MSWVERRWLLFLSSVFLGCLVTGLLIWVGMERGDEQSHDTRADADTVVTDDSPTPSEPASPSGSPSASESPSPEGKPKPKKPKPKQSPEPTPTDPPAVTYAFPISGCDVSYSADHHNYPATDIFAAAGCAFVAPVAGVVDEVGTVDEWTRTENRGEDRGGLFVSVVGDDGVRYYGSHLSAVAPGIAPGTDVEAGTRLGSIGETGSAAGTGAHLHFGISWPSDPGMWWVRRGVVSPATYLDAWRDGRQQSPVTVVAETRTAQEDQLRTCQQYC